jgi:protein ImuA
VALHPALWHAHQLGRPGTAVQASGFATLDAQLPGGGWPLQALTELLLPHAGVGELRLLAPALAALQQRQRSLMWFDPPAAPCAEALAALGIDLEQLVVVHSRMPIRAPRPPSQLQSQPQPAALGREGPPPPGRPDPPGRPARPGGLLGRARERLPAADVLWALEQALKSGHVGAVLAWLPARLPADALRRLQLAAQAHEGPAFLLRDAALCRGSHGNAALPPSPAPLRLALASAGPDRLRVTLLKRRGPPLAQPILLALPPVLSPPARARAGQSIVPPAPSRTPSFALSPTAAAVWPWSAPSPPSPPSPLNKGSP